jgi:two-component system response regulator LytT
MQALIIEDEIPASKRLKKMVQELEPNCTILDVIDSVEDAVNWFKNYDHPDVVFMDIQLADGLSFDIFEQVQIEAAVIFTTAYDQYAIKAFKVNGIDYLLKPIDKEDLKVAVEKCKAKAQPLETVNYTEIIQALQQQSKTDYRQRFMIKVGEQLKFVPVGDIAYLCSDAGQVSLVTNTAKEMVLDFSLDQLVPQLDPKHFFRINRKMIVHVSAIGKIHTYFNSRLKLDLTPAPTFDVIVARDRVNDFKLWLDS